MSNKKIHVLGGGTINYVRNHLALCAPAFGETARELAALCQELMPDLDTELHLTRMAGGDDNLVTSQDIEHLLMDHLVKDPATKVIINSVAICDFEGEVSGTVSNKYARKLGSHWEGEIGNVISGKHEFDINRHLNKEMPELHQMKLFAVPKILPWIRRSRKDIFLVAFKTTTHLDEDQQYLAALELLKGASCNLVLANDTVERRNMIVTPEEARYCVTKDRKEVLRTLVEMTKTRSQLTFTRSTVVSGDPIPWNSPLVYPSLRIVVDHCIGRGAYKPFRGATVGHFACKIDNNVFLTSIRKSNFNDLARTGLVKVVTDGPDNVIAYGAKPSVGGQSQRIVFEDHPDYDCIVHFHCPKKPVSKVPVVSQKEYECGSHECGRNTSKGLQRFGNLSAVYLDEHGPNIVFNHAIEPREVIQFIEDNFDLSLKTGGYVSLGEILSTPDHLEDLQAIRKQS